jgi:hypothetical protein
MKSILNEWRMFLKEGNELEEILDKVREIFFGAYNSWEKEYKLLHGDKKFDQYMEQIKINVRKKYPKWNDRWDLVVRNAEIGISLYWSDEPKYGTGSHEMCKWLIMRKLDILLEMCTGMERDILKNGMFHQIVSMVSEKRTSTPYPIPLKVSSGVINGYPVNDAYMTTWEGMTKYVLPALKQRGFYMGEIDLTPPDLEDSPERPDWMSKDELRKHMDKFDLRKQR